MTWIDVVDSAVKIGLGALIGGFVSILTIKLNHKNQLIQTRDERLAKALEDVSHQFENTCSHAFTNFATFGKDIFAPALFSKNKHAVKQAITVLAESELERDLKFQELIGILRLYGCLSAAETLKEISDSFTEITDRFESALKAKGPPTERLGVRMDYDSKSQESLKLKFYQELNKKINNPS